MNWIPISERLPPIGQLAVVYSTRGDRDDDNDGIDQYEGCWVIRPRADVSSDAILRWADRHQVTHWMPLPEPPMPMLGAGAIKRFLEDIMLWAVAAPLVLLFMAFVWVFFEVRYPWERGDPWER